MRNPPFPEGVFKPKPTVIETRQDATTKAARDILDSEVAIREAKTERLRAARLAAEAGKANAAPTAVRLAKRRCSARSSSSHGLSERR